MTSGNLFQISDPLIDNTYCPCQCYCHRKLVYIIPSASGLAFYILYYKYEYFFPFYRALKYFSFPCKYLKWLSKVVSLHELSFCSLPVYLFVGLMVMFLVLRTFHKLADVHGWTAFFQLPSCEEEDEYKEPIIDGKPDDESPEAEKASIKQRDPNSQVSYNSING